MLERAPEEPKQELSIEEIREKRNKGEAISPEDYMRLKEHDMAEDREENEKLYVARKPTSKVNQDALWRKGPNPYL